MKEIERQRQEIIQLNDRPKDLGDDEVVCEEKIDLERKCYSTSTLRHVRTCCTGLTRLA